MNPATRLLFFLSLSSALALFGETFPGESWESLDPSAAGLDERKLHEARDYALTGSGSGMVIHCGREVLKWGSQDARYDLKSTTKSIGVSALGLALMDDKVELDDKAIDFYPELGREPASNVKTGWLPEISLWHLATQTAGFEKPGGFTELLFRPGTKWDYSDSGPYWLADCLTLTYQQDMDALLFERVFTPIGISRNDLVWRNHSYRPRELEGLPRREFGSGISANVDAMARIGLLYLHEGAWDGAQLLPANFVSMASRPVEGVVGLPEHGGRFGNASDHYGLLWWNNADGTIPEVPRDAFWSWGLYDSLIVVIPSLDLVAARAGKSWKRPPRSGHYDVLAPFLVPLVAAVTPGQGETTLAATDNPQDKAVPNADDYRLEWAPADTIIRRAKGSDNWPLTSGDDGALYGAYGDGNGFEPFVDRKLSLGLVRVTGGPEDFVGENLRAPSIELTGNGRAGGKASGILMVDGVLYLWVRNRDNSQLAWSEDRGQSWTWADWKFTTSFGAPTFLNFGPNYAGALDDFVYVYAFDHASAYQRGDRMVLARVPQDRILDQDAYAYFERLDEKGAALWTNDIKQRGAVFEDPGECYRSGVSYNAGLGQFVWAQIKDSRKNDTRFQGGLGVYFADRPWGPWRKVYYVKRWDIGPGESASFPPQWMSEDGREMHLVFSGDDHFSVRAVKVLGRRKD